jgi:hypothetical protein
MQKEDKIIRYFSKFKFEFLRAIFNWQNENLSVQNNQEKNENQNKIN